jgi:hypothetical protein
MFIKEGEIMTINELKKYSIFFDMVLQITPKLCLIDNTVGNLESYYKVEDNTICIDKRYLNGIQLMGNDYDDMDQRLISVLAHEKRHAYQYMNLSPQWQSEFDQELDPIKDEALYLQQDIEIDARAFSVMIQSRLFNKFMSVDELIREKVVQRANELYVQYRSVLDSILPPGR